MTRNFKMAVAPILLVGILCALNCSQPLNDASFPSGQPGGGSNTTDTVIVHDTVTVQDSLIVTDTVVITDTITIVDTVIVHPPDSGSVTQICARLGSQQKELVWLFVNELGLYRLDFVAMTEKLQPTQILLVEIGDETIEWIPAEHPELILDKTLADHSTVKISPKCPSAFGHSIDICLWVSKL